MFEQVFISYRRVGGDVTAKLICESLKSRGYKVFYDYDSINNGRFDKRIFTAIEKCNDFILVLSPGALDNCNNENDWVRWEIRHALKQKNKNIIPVLLPGFDFPNELPYDIRDIKTYNGVPFVMAFFEGVIDSIEKRMITKPSKWKAQRVDKREVYPSPSAKMANEVRLKPSHGLKYTKNILSYGYKVIGIGSFNGERLVIPATHLWKPVTKVEFSFYTISKKQQYISSHIVKEIIFSEGIEEIEVNSLSGFKSLERIVLPSSLKKMSASLRECENLKEIIFHGSIDDWKRIRSNSYNIDFSSRSRSIICNDGICEYI